MSSFDNVHHFKILPQKNAMSQICPPSVCAHFLHYSLFTNKNVNRVNILSVHCTLFVCSCKNVIYLVPKSKSGTISLSSLLLLFVIIVLEIAVFLFGVIVLC